MKKLSFAAAFAAFSLATVATPAFAAKPVVSATPTLGATSCALTDISPKAASCAGWYAGNLVNGSTLAEQAFALNSFLGTGLTSSTLTWLETLPSLSGLPGANFATALYGDTVVAFHVGAAKGAGGIGYQGTAFFRFDAGNLVGGLDSVGFNRAGLSNARLYRTGKFITTAVPEPATWGMMLLGFGIVGSALRRRRTFAIA